jgi:taurine dioxygenase
MWHTDGSFLEYPTETSILVAKKLPQFGGDTMFASMYEAYDMLHPTLRSACDELEVVHAFPDVNKNTKHGFNPSLSREAPDRVDPRFLKGRPQPLVVVHPDTGRRALYLNRSYTKDIVGMPEAQSRHLLALLYEHASQSPEFQLRFCWKVGSIAMWDNRCTMHYAVSDYSTERTMWRVMIGGTRPLQGPAHAAARPFY